jgi:hypothetical protein
MSAARKTQQAGITQEPILFLVSNGLLEHKPRMGMAVWTYLWFLDKVTRDVPDGKGKFDGLVLGNTPFKAERIAHDLHDHVQTVLENVRKLEVENYIVRKRHAGNLCSFIVTNSKKWFWRRVSEEAQSRENANTHSEEPDKAQTLTQSEPMHSLRVSQNTLTYKERHDSDTTQIKSISSESKASDQARTPVRRTTATPPSQEACTLVALLKSEILRNKADYRITPGQEEKWAVTAQRMLDLDKRDLQEIADLICWVQQDEFWMANVLSMDKLRQKFDQLQLKRQADSKPKKSRQDLAVEQFDKEMQERRRDAVNS